MHRAFLSTVTETDDNITTGTLLKGASNATSRHYLMLNISETVRDTYIVSMEY